MGDSTPACSTRSLEARLVQLEISRVALEKEIQGLREALSLRFDLQAESVKISSSEVVRRLDLLNGEAERLRMMQATYLPREVWDLAQAEVVKTLAALRESRSEIEGRREQIDVGRQQSHWFGALVISSILALVAIIVSVIAMLRK